MVVLDLYCVLGTFLFAYLTADTAVLAYSTGELAAVDIGTAHAISLRGRDHIYQIIRADSCAFSTTTALARIYHCNAVYHRDSVVLTHIYTVAQTVASAATGALSVVETLGGNAGLCTGEDVSVLRRALAAVAAHECHLTLGIEYLGAHYLSELLCRFGAARLAEVGLSLTLRHRLCVALAAREATGAAVAAGESLVQLRNGLVRLHKEQLAGAHQQCACRTAYNAEYQYGEYVGHQKFHHTPPNSPSTTPPKPRKDSDTIEAATRVIGIP